MSTNKVHHFFMESFSLSILLLFSLLLLFNIPRSHSFNTEMQPKCHEKERNALLDFKATFYNESCLSMTDLNTWTLKGQKGDCCNWDGIECDEHSGHVIGLDLSLSCLSGSINSNSSIFKLSNLQRLNLASNDFFHSEIPPAISNLSQLKSLDLSGANFSGQIPLGIINLTNLSFLRLSYNQLKLKNPSLRDLVQSLVKLEQLDLGGVEILSSVPDSISRLTSLKTLSLTNCKLQGQIPPSMANLSKLEWLYLYNNQLTGEIFPQLSRLTKLRSVILSSNKFSGQIPSTISLLKNLTSLLLGSNNFNEKTHVDVLFQLDSLQILDLSYNNVSFVTDGSIKPKSKLLLLLLASCNLRSFPLLLQSQDSLLSLDLSCNNISGEVPLWFMDSVENLSFLNLSHNHLSGFEGNFPLLKWSLQYLDLTFNHMKGSLPIPSTNSNIQYYLVSNNQFSGELPTNMCNLVGLKIFDVGNNNLSGMIPQCLGDLVGMGNLSVLNLHNNNFNGPIPQVGRNRCNLVMIDMSYNQLEGPMPRDMENCPNLGFLNLGNNKINDVFPFWLGKLPTLSILILRSNRFHGIIEKPAEANGFHKLQIIILSNNNFTGCLPAQYFKGWMAMKIDADREDRKLSYASFQNGSDPYFYTVTMTDKGINVEYTKIPETLSGIDLSSNHFIGEIPKSMGTLKGLHFLNISNNVLAGLIPINLNGLINLESLDLSCNKLSGKIPQQLTDLTALSSFNVSFNQLTGHIPQSKQFDTFENSSYQGNSGLCGLPLSKKCGNIIATSPLPSFKKDHALRTWIENNWKIVCMGYTSGLVIGVVMGMNWTRGCKRVKRARQIKFTLS